MSYFKKLCVLKQLASGFASDGKKVSGLVTIERYGSRTNINVSLINFAPLSDGRYIAAICDTHGSLEFCELTNSGNIKKGESLLNVADGFACLVCFVGVRVQPVAFGKCGDAVYDVKKICVFITEKEKGEKANAKICDIENNKSENNAEYNHDLKISEKSESLKNENKALYYDDEVVATENYYEYDDADLENLKITENNNESLTDATVDKYGESDDQTTQKTSKEDACENEDAKSLFKLENDRERTRKPEYFEQVKNDILELFEKYPSEENLERAVDNSKWVKIEFAPEKYYTVGIIYDLDVPKYICYGVPSNNKNEPPKALKGYCSYLPLSLFDLRGKGYWMMYQDAASGQCVEIEYE